MKELNRIQIALEIKNKLNAKKIKKIEKEIKKLSKK